MDATKAEAFLQEIRPVIKLGPARRYFVPRT
jgi:hypothetical protein